jgi:hypothetical protein
MDLEAKISLEVIFFYKKKIENLFMKIDEKFILMNEVKHKLEG